MTINNPDASSQLRDDEINMEDMAAVLRRRWIWVASGGLLGLVIAGSSLLAPAPVEKSFKTFKLVVDTDQGPCAWTQLKFQKHIPYYIPIQCKGVFLSARKELVKLADETFKPAESLSVTIKPLEFGRVGDGNLASSTTQLELSVKADTDNSDAINNQLERLKTKFADSRIRNMQNHWTDVEVGKGWIQIETDPEVKVATKSKSSFRSIALGLFGGLALGSGAALIADRKSDRVFSNSRILDQLGYPLWLTLPTIPWPDQMVSPLIGQLATRLDPSLEWCVLSIGRENEVVGALAQALILQNEPGLSCKPVEPLLRSIIRLGSDSRPIGLLIVVESGFNSSQALEDARLLLSQLSCVHSIGVVLAGVPLPSELTVREKA